MHGVVIGVSVRLCLVLLFSTNTNEKKIFIEIHYNTK